MFHTKLRPGAMWGWMMTTVLWAIRLRDIVRFFRFIFGENGPFDL